MQFRYRLMALAGLAALAIAGCGKKEESAPNPDVGAKTGGAATAGEITFATSDGWTIHADYAPAPGAKKAVILLHQRNGSAADWKPLVEKLNAAGIAALALDQRGAGRSQGRENGDNAPWDTSNDIAGAYDWLKQQGFAANHIGLAGASYGANNALLYAASHSLRPPVALLSPGTDYHGLKIELAASHYQGAVLILTAKDDTIPEDGPALINRVAPGPHELKSYDGKDHGTDLFAAHADSLDAITEFFKTKL